MNTGTTSRTEGIIGLVSAIRDKANRLILELLRKQGVEDVVPAYGGIFVHLFRAGEMTMGDMAKAIDRDKSTLTALVKRLVKLGYLEVDKAAYDQRVSLLRLTEKGRALAEPFSRVSAELLERTFAGFSEGERLVLVELLGRINGNLNIKP